MSSTARLRLKKPPESVTVQAVTDILGPLDSGILAAILDTGASLEEIRRAAVWLDENHYTQATADRPMSQKMRRVYEILDYARSRFE